MGRNTSLHRIHGKSRLQDKRGRWSDGVRKATWRRPVMGEFEKERPYGLWAGLDLWGPQMRALRGGLHFARSRRALSTPHVSRPCSQSNIRYLSTVSVYDCIVYVCTGQL